MRTGWDASRWVEMSAVVIKRVERHLRGICEQTVGNHIRRPALEAVQLWTAINSQHDFSAVSAVYFVRCPLFSLRGPSDTSTVPGIRSFRTSNAFDGYSTRFENDRRSPGRPLR